ncbi:MAG: hypothetical protein AAGK04_00775 [Planctomycetota bacterium]
MDAESQIARGREALRGVFAERPLLPAFAAALFVERMLVGEGQGEAAGAMDLERRRDAVASAIRTVMHNADMLEAVRNVLVRSDLPVVDATSSSAFVEEARRHLETSLREVADDAYAWAPEGVWREAAAVVIASLFGEEADRVSDGRSGDAGRCAA